MRSYINIYIYDLDRLPGAVGRITGRQTMQRQHKEEANAHRLPSAEHALLPRRQPSWCVVRTFDFSCEILVATYVDIDLDEDGRPTQLLSHWSRDPEILVQAQ